MPTEFHNIDEMLMQPNNTTTPPSPELKDVEAGEAAAIENVSQETLEPESSYSEPQDSQEEPEAPKQEISVDEYGNEEPKAAEERLYTREELKEQINQAVRERLSRGQHSQAQQQHIEQQAQNFEYDENAAGDWQQQLAKFVRQEFQNMNKEIVQQTQQQREQQAQIEFQQKFEKGLGKFADYTEVVDASKISDPMLLATRGLPDPAAFLYAASKRAPQELERISRLQDPYAQMMEMGKLEERLKKSPAVTKTPKPVSKPKDDLPIPHSSNKKETIEDLIAESNARRLQLVNSRRR